MCFSTPDQDNDIHPSANCASIVAWWMKACSRSFVNGDTNAEWNAFSPAVFLDVTDTRMMVKLD